jgi:hypothetical protein
VAGNAEAAAYRLRLSRRQPVSHQRQQATKDISCRQRRRPHTTGWRGAHRAWPLPWGGRDVSPGRGAYTGCWWRRCAVPSARLESASVEHPEQPWRRRGCCCCGAGPHAVAHEWNVAQPPHELPPRRRRRRRCCWRSSPSYLAGAANGWRSRARGLRGPRGVAGAPILGGACGRVPGAAAAAAAAAAIRACGRLRRWSWCPADTNARRSLGGRR